MKVNEEVFEMGTELQQAGTPAFVGVPIVHSVFELAEHFDCLWFALRATDESQPEWHVECEGGIVLPRNGALLGPCRDKEVCQIVEAQSQTRSWEEAVDTIRQVQNRGKQTQRSHFRFGPVYKPVYFMVW